MRFRPLISSAACAFTALSAGAVVAIPAADAATASTGDAFYTYSGSTPLAAHAPGDVLAQRDITYHMVGIPSPIKGTQVLYRSTDAQNRPVANVTTVLKPAKSNGKAVAYQSYYDSLSVADSPSRVLAGGLPLGGLPGATENLFIQPLLDKGYSVVIADVEGPKADFAAGAEYAHMTLDSMRAASKTKDSGINTTTKFAMFGYSGGGIATSWASALAPSYAPDINKRTVGYAEGGLLVDPIRNLDYVSGSSLWAGVTPMALAGYARAYGLDLTPYLSQKGINTLNGVQNMGIAQALLTYPYLKGADLFKPQYSDLRSIPPLLSIINKVNLGNAPTPTMPGYIGQGAGGWAEGTLGNKPGIGPGDGVMIAGDVRSLAIKYCTSGAPAVKYTEYPALSHTGTLVSWAPSARAWIDDRFAGKAAPSDCGHIAAGNSLAPEKAPAK